MVNNLSDIELFVIDLKSSELILKCEDTLLFKAINFLGPSFIGVLDKIYVLNLSKHLLEGASYIYG